MTFSDHADRLSPANPHAEPTAPPEFPRPAQPGDLTPTLKMLLAGRTLSADQAEAAFEAMMSGQSHHGEMGALLALLATRIPTADEILGAARVMRRHVDRVPTVCPPESLLDTAGTGGAPKTFNVSTAAAIIAAAVMRAHKPVQAASTAPGAVAKHGNRSRTGRGSAEVLRQLGVNIDADRDVQAKCLDEVGVCFCFAIHHHPATRHVMPVRLALGFPTIFNLLGPLTNPAGASRQLMGVYDKRFLRPIAEALRDLGAIRVMVVHSRDGLDELSIAAPTYAVSVERDQVREMVIDPRELGLTNAPLEAITAKDLEHAGRMILDVLTGADRGPARDMALLNAAAAILVAGWADSLVDGLARAAEAVDSGAAHHTLQQLARVSQG